MVIICFKFVANISLLSFEQISLVLFEIKKKKKFVSIITFPIEKLIAILYKVLSDKVFPVKILPLIMFENILKLLFGNITNDPFKIEWRLETEKSRSGILHFYAGAESVCQLKKKLGAILELDSDFKVVF